MPMFAATATASVARMARRPTDGCAVEERFAPRRRSAPAIVTSATGSKRTVPTTICVPSSIG